MENIAHYANFVSHLLAAVPIEAFFLGGFSLCDPRLIWNSFYFVASYGSVATANGAIRGEALDR